MLGIVILNYRTPLDVVSCSAALDNDTVEKKIYIVDNHSADGSYELLRKKFEDRSNYCVVGATENRGYSAGNNIGINLAIADKCTEILIINPDVIVREGAIDGMFCILYSDNRIALVGPKVIDNEGNVYKTFRRSITVKSFISNHFPMTIFHRRKYDDDVNYVYDENSLVIGDGMVSGCCYMIKANIICELGLMDDEIFLYHEEDVMWAKMHAKKYLGAINPDAVVDHRHSGSIGSVLSPFSRMHTELSALYFLRAYCGLKGIQFWWCRQASKMNYLYINWRLGYKMERYRELKCGIKKIQKTELNSKVPE